MRILLRLLSPLFGLAVATTGTVLAVEAGWALAQPRAGALLVPWPRWRNTLAGYSWSDTPTLISGAVLALAGLLLILLAGRARRGDVCMTNPAQSVTVATSPRSLARAVGQRVREQDGVTAASVTVTARSVRVRVTTTRLHPPTELQPALTSRVTELLSDLPLTRTPGVRVIVAPTKDRR